MINLKNQNMEILTKCFNMCLHKDLFQIQRAECDTRECHSTTLMKIGLSGTRGSTISTLMTGESIFMTWDDYTI